MAISRTAANLNIKVTINNTQVNGELQNTQSTFTKFFKDIQRTASGFVLGDIISRSIRNGIESMKSMAVEFANFDQQMRSVAKVTDIQGKELDNLAKQFVDLSKKIPVTAQEFAEMGAVAGQLGIKGSQQIETFAKTTAVAATALGMSAEDTARKLAQLGIAAQLDIKNSPEILGNLANTINELGDSAATTSPEIIEAMLKSAQAAQSLDIPIDKLAAMSTALLEVGIPAEEVGTSLKNSFIFASTKTQEFAKVLGVTADVAKERLGRDATGTLIEFAQKAASVGTSVDGLSLAAEIFGTRSSKAIISFGNSTKRLTELLELSANSITNVNSLNKEFASQSQGLNAIMTLLGNQFKALALEIGIELAPIVKGILLEFIAWRQELDRDGKMAQKIVSFIKEMIQTIIDLNNTFNILENLGNIFTFVTENARQLFIAFLLFKTSALDTYATNLQKKLEDLGVKGFNKLKETTIQSFTAMRAKFSENIAAFKMFKEEHGGLFKGIGNQLKTFVTSTSTAFKANIASFKVMMGSLSRIMNTPVNELAKNFMVSVRSFRASATSMKLDMTSIKLAFGNIGKAALAFGTKVQIGTKIANVALKAFRLSLKITKAALTFGLSLVLDWIIEKIIIMSEEFGGFFNMIKAGIAKIKGIFTFGSDVQDNVDKAAAGFKKFGEAATKSGQTAADALNSELMNKGLIPDDSVIASRDEILKNQSGKEILLASETAKSKRWIDQFENEQTYKGIERNALKSAKTLTKINQDKEKINTQNFLTENTQRILKALGIEKEMQTFQLGEYAKMLLKKAGLNIKFQSADELIRVQGEKKVQENILKLKEQELNEKFKLELSFEEKLAKMEDEKRAEAFKKRIEDANKSSKEIAAIISSTPLEFVQGGGFEALMEKGGTGLATAGTAGMAANALAGGESGGAKLATDLIKTGLTAALGPIGEALGPVVDLLAATPDQFKTMIDGFIKGMLNLPFNIIQNFLTFIPTFITSLKDAIIGIFQRLPEIFTAFLEYFFGVQVIELFVDLTETLIEMIPDVISAMVERIPIFINSLVARIPTIVTKFIELMIGGIPMLISNMITAIVRGIPTIIKSFVDGIIKGVPLIVKGIVDGIANGIKGLFKGLSFGLFAQGGVVPSGYPNDSFPAMLSSGERVLSVAQTRAFDQGVLAPPQIREDGGVRRTMTDAASAVSKTMNVSQSFHITINGGTAQTNEQLTEMIIDRIRTESARGRAIIESSGVNNS